MYQTNISQPQNLFQPGSLGSINPSNRLVVAPMTRISGKSDGTIGPLMTEYYVNFAKGGFGVIITEGVYTDQAYSQGYINQPGIATNAHLQSWKPLVTEVKSHGAKFIMQLMHAGALSQHNAHENYSKAPSAITPKGEQMSFYHGIGAYPTPQAMSQVDINQVVEGFVQSAERVKEAGFDGVEIHAANGYLLDQFLTDYTNKRTDNYGGTVVNRLSLTCEIATAVRKQVGSDFVIGIRISQGKVNDFEHKWRGGVDEAAVIFKTLAKSGIDYIHTTEYEADKPAFAEGPSLASLARKFSALPVIANGAMSDAKRASALLHKGDADFVSIAKGALANNNWPMQVRDGQPLKEFDFQMFTPFADLESANNFLASN